MAAGETVTAERFGQLLDQISEVKHQLAAQLQQLRIPVKSIRAPA
jgi:hypothetical protein